ncbi:MAG: hypothetical protein HY903_10725 [Deltaproteobacteria bacterium]|nr:hypothetical protein [Deltaproteobacteria bacterium]
MLAIGLSGCGGDETETTSCGDAQACAVPWDCAVGYTCESGCCAVFGCTPDSCGDGSFCDADSRACTSISEKCEFTGCDCHVVNGAGELEATGTPTIALAAGGETQVSVVLAAKGGLPLPGSTFTYTIDDTSLFTVSTTGRLTAASPGSAGTATLTAKAGTYATCTASLVHQGAAAGGGKVRFYVADDRTAQPVAGATIYVDLGAGDGNPDETLTSGANGIVTTANPVSGAYTVSVFAPGYNYLSIVGLDAAKVSDVTIPLAARKVPKTTAGFTGKPDYSTYEKLVLGGRAKTIKFGIISGSFLLKTLLNFDLDLFVGPITQANCSQVDANGNHPAGCYKVDIPGIISNQWSPLPGGVVLSLATNPIKSHFDVVVQPGRRYAWGMGGEVEIADLSGLINVLTPFLSECTCDATQNVCDAGCTCDGDCGVTLDFGAVFNNLLPLFARFASGVKGDLPAKEVALSTWENYIDDEYGPNRTDPTGNFPLLDTGSPYGKLAIREPLLSFSDLQVAALPADPGATDGRKMEGVVVLTGVNSKGYGFVPLGITAGLDCTTTHCLDRTNYPGDFDGHINGGLPCQYDPDPTKNGCPPGVPTSELATDHVGMFHAKAHGGLEDQEWLTIALSFPISALADSTQSNTIRVTATVVRAEPTVGASTQLDVPFPSFPAEPTTTLGRTFTVTANADAQVHWVTAATKEVKDTDTSNPDWIGLTTRWNVFYPAEGGTFTAPQVPASVASGNPLPDPFAPTADSEINITHIRFRAPGSTLDDLAANNGTTLGTLLDVTTGFAVQSLNVTVN